MHSLISNSMFLNGIADTLKRKAESCSTRSLEETDLSGLSEQARGGASYMCSMQERTRGWLPEPYSIHTQYFCLQYHKSM